MNAVTDKLRRSLAHGSVSNIDRRSPEPIEQLESESLFTPDASTNSGFPSQRPISSRPRSLRLERNSSAADSASASNPASRSQSIFGGNVATPPITDADAEPFSQGETQTSVPILSSRPGIDVAAAQDASLPSPRLSPTLAASQPHTAEDGEDGEASGSFTTNTTLSNDAPRWPGSMEDEGGTLENSLATLPNGSFNSESFTLSLGDGTRVALDAGMMMRAFDSMKTEMKTWMMFQFLRRCPRPTLRVVANAVNPALKCDFFSRLPLELCYQILSYLDHQDLTRAAQASKQWRNIVDRNETGWKELLDRDGYILPKGELTKAINQGWGWQDPEGFQSCERDLSMHNRLTSSDSELTKAIKPDPEPKTPEPRTPEQRTRRSKRKRGLNTYSASERLKRRAGNHEGSSSREGRAEVEVRQHKSEGPISAAMAAATAVTDPHLGLPSLRHLHLFKSLYRRHHMIRKSWMSGEVKPSHVAFTAHPRHVVTCLQFDDDKIITGSDDTFIHVYDTKTGKLRKKLQGHEGGVWALQYEGNILVSGSTDRSVRVWDIERGLCQQVFYGHTSTVRCLQILMPTKTGVDTEGKAIMQPEKPLIITGSRDSHLRVWRLPEVGSRRYYQTGVPLHEHECPYFVRALTGHTHSVRAIAAHGDTLVSGSYDSVVRVWRVSTGECVHVLHGHSQKVYSVILDHKRNRCISGSMDSLVKIWDLTTGACLYTLEGHSLLVGLLDLRDDRLVSAAADATLRIWDPETGRCRNELMAHTGAITCFQHDGSKVISGSEKTVKMWDVATGDCKQDLLTDLSGVWQVKFDGRRCVAAVQRDRLTYIEVSDNQ